MYRIPLKFRSGSGQAELHLEVRLSEKTDVPVLISLDLQYIGGTNKTGELRVYREYE